MRMECLGPLSEDQPVAEAVPGLHRAARLLQRGRLVAAPTETTYGLFASIFREEGIRALYAVKRRPIDRPLPVQVTGIEQLKLITDRIPSVFFRLTKRFFPGALTVVLKKAPFLSPLITGGRDAVAVRAPLHGVAQGLIRLVGCPLVASSANISDRPSATRAQHVMEDLRGRIDMLIDGGESRIGLESSVLSLEDPERPLLLRLGAVLKEEIEEALGSSVFLAPRALFGKAPSHAHFPGVRLFPSWHAMRTYLGSDNRHGSLIMSDIENAPLPIRCDAFLLKDNNLYEGLRMATRKGYGEVLVLVTPSLLARRALYRYLRRVAIPG